VFLELLAGIGNDAVLASVIGLGHDCAEPPGLWILILVRTHDEIVSPVFLGVVHGGLQA